MTQVRLVLRHGPSEWNAARHPGNGCLLVGCTRPRSFLWRLALALAVLGLTRK
jgi:hypothetical protein